MFNLPNVFVIKLKVEVSLIFTPSICSITLLTTQKLLDRLGRKSFVLMRHIYTYWVV